MRKTESVSSLQNSRHLIRPDRIEIDLAIFFLKFVPVALDRNRQTACHPEKTPPKKYRLPLYTYQYSGCPLYAKRAGRGHRLRALVVPARAAEKALLSRARLFRHEDGLHKLYRSTCLLTHNQPAENPLSRAREIPARLPLGS